MTTQERFWSKVNKTGTCWLWTRPPGTNGYGQFWAHGKNVSAHTFAYRIQCGDPGDRFVLHTCDNRLCVKKDHLFLGTQADNIADKVAKNRQARGEKHGMSKLSDAQRDSITSDPRIRQRGRMTHYARKYGVTCAAISILVGRGRSGAT